MNGRQAAGPRYRSQSTSSLGGSGSGGAQPLVLAVMPAGWAWTACSLPSFPVRASSQAKAKCGRFRRCVPAWKTRPVRRIVSASARLCAMFFVQGFSQYMSLPARAAMIAAVACQFGPVAISTASMSSRASSSRKSR